MSAINHRSSKRRRRRPPAHFHAVTAQEERFLQAAIQNSKLDKARHGKLSVPYGPTFYPTIEDFQGNPIDYVEKIRPTAEKYGICKIVPPEGWNPAPYFALKMANPKKKFQTKLQMLHRLQEGISFGDGLEYNVDDYQRVASKRSKEWKERNYPRHDVALDEQKKDAAGSAAKGDGNVKPEKTASSSGTDAELFSPENLERDYWQIVETHTQQVSVEYGNDVDTQSFGSGFPLSERGRSINGTKIFDDDAPEPEFGTADYYKETWWNLNNIPLAPDSVLRHVKVGINGINVPWMYFGSLFTTFCWHNEDNYMYSINYHHRGAPKQWYGVPGNKESADGLERVFKSYLSMKMRDVPDLLHHITTMFSPRLLQNADVPVCKLVQYEGEFIITFPRSFHGGFSFGPNIGEAVNFAPYHWIAYGSDANERYRSFARPAVFSHDRLTFTMAKHYEEQKVFASCKLLLEELERVVAEEFQLREKLTASGVRDVSHLISLPKNVLEQLDENSANYDDKRLCHACKHVCFFSAVACECSQSKVSCLRHSHYMCRCPTERKYFMIWSTKDELAKVLECVQAHCQVLKNKEQSEETQVKQQPRAEDEELAQLGLLGEGNAAAGGVAPGAERDLALHKFDHVSTDAVRQESFLAFRPRKRAEITPPMSPVTCVSVSGLPSRLVSASSEEDSTHRTMTPTETPDASVSDEVEIF